MSRFHDLDARIAGAIAEATRPEPDQPDPTSTPAEPQPAPTPATEPEEEQPMADETPVEQTDAYQAGFKAANDRMTAVFASEHFPGREAHAARLLGNAKLGADEVVAELPHFAKQEAIVDQAAVTAAAEEAARQEMAETMQGRGNANLGGDQSTDGKRGRAAADATWDRARAHVDNSKKKEA